MQENAKPSGKKGQQSTAAPPRSVDWNSVVADFCRLTQVTELDTKIAKCDEARQTWKKMKQW